MGSACSQPTASVASVQPSQEILVLVEQINMVNSRPNSDVLQLKRMLSRNSSVLRKRIAGYEEKLKGIDHDSPAGKIYIAEIERAEDLLKKLLRMQIPLAYMA